MGRKTKFTKHIRTRFLRVLAETGVYKEACIACGVTWEGDSKYAKAHPEFAEQVAMAKEEYNEFVLEAELKRRAVEGVDEPIYQQGQLVGYKKVYSDSLLKTKLAAAMPEKYGNKTQVQHTGAIEHKHTHEVTAKESLLEKFNKLLPKGQTVEGDKEVKALPQDTQIIDVTPKEEVHSTVAADSKDS